jgi:uncharacterized protein YqgV (UPF0045/DUF77 family)
VSVLVAFSVTPLGVGESVGEIVAEAVRVVRDSGLPNKTDASVVIKADWRSGVTNAMAGKTASVERHLSVRRSDP